MGGSPTSFLERTCPEKHLNLSKTGFIREEGHSGSKSQEVVNFVDLDECVSQFQGLLDLWGAPGSSERALLGRVLAEA